MSRCPAPLPTANPTLAQCGSCDSRKPLVYLAAGSRNEVKRPSLSLLWQELACRRFARQRLHQTIEAEFADGAPLPPTRRRAAGVATSRRPGFAKLLGHLRRCRNRRVVVARLETLSSSRDQLRLRQIGARVLSATEPNTHASLSRADTAEQIRRDIDRLFSNEDQSRKEAKQ